MSTKESIHSSKSGRSAHSNEESLLVDTEYDPNQKKKNMRFAIIAGIIFLVMGVAVFFAIFQSSKLSDANDRKEALKRERDERLSKRQREKTYKVLNLSNANLKDIAIGIDPKEDNSVIEVLNLTKNYIQEFNHFVLPNLTSLYLEGNPLTSFTDNRFEILADINLPGNSIADFDNNYFPKLRVLRLKNHQKLLSFENNYLPEVTSFEITDSLIDFNGNYLPLSEQFRIDELKSIETITDNTLNIDTLTIDSPNLRLFQGNSFPLIREATIKQSKLQTLEFQNSPQLVTLRVQNSPSLKTLILRNLPKLTTLLVDSPALQRVIIDNVNITSFPFKTESPELNADLFKTKYLTILNSPVSDCNLLQMTQLLQLQLRNIPLQKIDLIQGKPNLLQSIALENIRMGSFSNNTLEFIKVLELKDNIRLERMENNNMPLLTDLNIIGRSGLESVNNNSFARLERVSFINSTDAKLVLNGTVAKFIPALTLINNDIKQLDLTNYNNLSTLIIKQNPIKNLDLMVNKTTLKRLQLDLNELESLTIVDTSITSFNQLQQPTFVLIAPSLHYLKIAKTPLTEFTNFNRTQALKQFYLEDTQVTNFSHNNLPALEDLHIIRAPLTTLDLTTSQSSLKNINIQETWFDSFGTNVFPNVHTVQLLGNKRISLINSSSFPNMENLMIDATTDGSLDTLILQHTNLVKFQQDLTYLKTLLIYNNPKLKTFTPTSLSHLTTLEIVDTPIETFKANLFGSLKNVTLKGVSIGQLIDSLGPTLESLYLQNNNLINLDINKYTNLKYLFVADNAIKQLEIKDLTKLTDAAIYLSALDHLTISNTGITNLTLVESSQSIDEITIINTPITNISSLSYTSLIKLELRNNNLEYIKGNNFGGLEHLYIYDNPNLKEINLTGSYELVDLELVNIGSPIIDYGSFLKKIHKLTLKNNLIATIDTSEMTSLQTIVLEGNFYTVILANTQVQSFSGFALDSLQNLTISNNTKLTTFENNNFESLIYLKIVNTSITSSQNNEFPLLSTVYIERSTYNLQALLDSIQPENIKTLTLKSVPIEQNPDFKKFTNLSFLEISEVELTSLTLTGLPVVTLNLNIPLLNTLKINNLKVPNYRFEGIPNLKTLEIINSPALKNFANQRIDNVQSLILSGNSIISFSNNTLTHLKSFALRDDYTTSINIASAPALATVEFVTPQLLTLVMNAPVATFIAPTFAKTTSITLKDFAATQFVITAPFLTTFSISSPTLTTLNLTNVYLLNSIGSSSTPALTTLWITNSPIVNVSTLTLTALTTLKIINSTTISFTLSKQIPLLQSLTLTSVNITTLDIGVYPQISELSLEINNLANLTLKNNKKLTKFLVLKSTSVQSISVSDSGLVQFSQLNLPQLRTLILSNNNLISYTSNNFPSIQTIRITDDHIEDIDIEQNKLKQLTITCPAVTDFRIYDSPLTSLKNLTLNSLAQLYIDNVTLSDAAPLASFGKLLLLQIYGSSGLKTLDFNNLPELNQVHIENTPKLQSINVTKNVKIVQLSIEQSPLLNTLNLGYFSSLLSLFIDNVGAIFTGTLQLNKLQILDLQNVKLASIQSLGLSNQIKTISAHNVSNLGNLDSAACANWDKLVSLSLETTSLTEFKCQNPSLVYISLADSPLTTLSIEANTQLTEIHLTKIQIPSFKNLNLPSLQRLTLYEIPTLSQISDNKFPKLFVLDLRDLPQVLNFSDANSDYSALTRLFIYNCTIYNQDYEPSKFPIMQQIGFLNTSIESVKIGKTTKTVAIGNQKSQSSIQFFAFGQDSAIEYFAGINTIVNTVQKLKAPTLKNIFLNQNHQLKVFTQNEFTGLLLLDLTNTAVEKLANNIMPALKTIYLPNGNLQKFYGNTLTSLQRLVLPSNNLEVLNQSLPAVLDIDFTSNKLTYINFALIPKITTLDLESNAFSIFNGHTNTEILDLTLSTNKDLKQFKNNNFASLTSLAINNCDGTQISGNTIPKLENLLMNGCKNFKDDALLTQLTKALTPNLKRVELTGSGYKASTITALELAFPGLIIVK